MTKDTSHPNFNIPPKKKKPKSKWMAGFKLAEKSTELDIIEFSRNQKIKHIKNKLIQSYY